MIAAAVQGTMGFAFSLIVLSFFLLILESGDAVQVLIVINLAISLSLVPRLWRDAHRGLLARLVLGALAGFPVGLWAFRSADVGHLKFVLAITLIAFVAAAPLWGRAASQAVAPKLRYRTPSALATGVLAGGMTTALGMPGPVLVLYLTAVDARRDEVRAISLTFFAVSYGVALILQAASIGMAPEVWITGAVLVPVAAVGAGMGHALARRVHEDRFRLAVLAPLGATGGYMLLDVIVR